jgi:hypothetical protein
LTAALPREPRDRAAGIDFDPIGVPACDRAVCWAADVEALRAELDDS